MIVLALSLQWKVGLVLCGGPLIALVVVSWLIWRDVQRQHAANAAADRARRSKRQPAKDFGAEDAEARGTQNA